MGASCCLTVSVSVYTMQNFGVDWICRLADWRLAGGSLFKRMFSWDGEGDVCDESLVFILYRVGFGFLSTRVFCF